MYDVWTSHLWGTSLALGKFCSRILPRFKIYMTISHPGMHGKGILIPDVNVSVEFHALDTFSDVLAIHQEPVRLCRRLPLFFDSLVHLTFSLESSVHRDPRRHDRQVGHQNVVAQPKDFSIQSG